MCTLMVTGCALTKRIVVEEIPKPQMLTVFASQPTAMSSLQKNVAAVTTEIT